MDAAGKRILAMIKRIRRILRQPERGGGFPRQAQIGVERTKIPASLAEEFRISLAPNFGYLAAIISGKYVPIIRST